MIGEGGRERGDGSGGERRGERGEEKQEKEGRGGEGKKKGLLDDQSIPPQQEIKHKQKKPHSASGE